MEPMNRNMNMKKVAGFHSFDFDFEFFIFVSGVPQLMLDLGRGRRGFGIRDLQKDDWITLGVELW